MFGLGKKLSVSTVFVISFIFQLSAFLSKIPATTSCGVAPNKTTFGVLTLLALASVIFVLVLFIAGIIFTVSRWQKLQGGMRYGASCSLVGCLIVLIPASIIFFIFWLLALYRSRFHRKK